MAQGITYSKEKVAEILETYKQTNSIYAAAKINKVHYLTAQKYIRQTAPKDSRSLLPQLKSAAPYIYNINKDIYKEDIKREDIREDNILYKDTNKILSPNNNIKGIASKDVYYIRGLNTILSKMLLRYKNEVNDIPISKMYLHFGTLMDKLNHLTGKDKAGPDSQVIMNFYGDDSKVKGLISKIKESKGSL